MSEASTSALRTSEASTSDANSSAKANLKRKVSLFAGSAGQKKLGRQSPGDKEDEDSDDYESENKMRKYNHGSTLILQ